MAKQLQKKSNADLCTRCGAKCCRYVAIEIDQPTCKKDHDHIRWYLLHKNVHVFMDQDGDWYVEFETPCEELGDSQLCGVYDRRPRICRHHGVHDGECEFLSDEEPHRERFSSADAYEQWLDAQGIDWRWKRYGG